ncbi:restriction endonuclease [Ilumatobacter fluminis]|uniref:Restriction endonuclease n=1 Tax=Ilumatobacter fluminis TaxID=467091 RepID=A0A4R7HWS4_9ACTN|nr:restriction endonuclease [Ilumatobacter fluminis]TDT14616.1 restriction endonuclease [Ilumatobacter fluminis]
MKLMPLRYPGNCVSCGVRIEQRTTAWYDPSIKKVTCTTCKPVDAQLSVDTAADTEPAPAEKPRPSLRPLRTDQQKGAELEKQVADVFAAAGYRVQQNVVREGRGGGRYEIDVLAEKTDEFLTLSVAIECKAWASPIDRDIVAKLNEARRDLGLGHALIVSLNGAKPGATQLAADTGVTIWGTDELKAKVGSAAITGLQHRPMIQEVGFSRRLSQTVAEQMIDKAASGTFGIGREEIVWQGAVWLPASVVQLDLKKMKVLGKTSMSQAWTVYDLVGGTYITRFDQEPQRLAVDMDGPKIAERLKWTDPAKDLTRIIDKFNSVKSDDAIARYRGQMKAFGVPDFHTATVGEATPFLYPAYLAIARSRNGSERLVVLDAYNNRQDDDLCTGLSRVISHVKASLPTARH